MTLAVVRSAMTHAHGDRDFSGKLAPVIGSGCGLAAATKPFAGGGS
jgi:hypothetical protein